MITQLSTYNFLFFVFMKIYLLAHSLSISADEHDERELKVGILSFPPFYVINPDKKPSGILTNIMKKTLQETELDYKLEEYPTKRLYKNLGTGETQLFLGVRGPAEYDKHVLYSNVVVSQIQMRIYAKGVMPLPSRKEDLNGHTIIVIRGYSYGGLIDYLLNPNNNIDVTSTSEHISSFLMLKNNRADYLINYKHPSESVLKDLEISDLKFTNYYAADVRFIVSKSTPNAESIMHKLEQAYLKLIALGELQYIPNDH